MNPRLSRVDRGDEVEKHGTRLVFDRPPPCDWLVRCLTCLRLQIMDQLKEGGLCRCGSGDLERAKASSADLFAPFGGGRG